MERQGKKIETLPTSAEASSNKLRGSYFESYLEPSTADSDEMTLESARQEDLQSELPGKLQSESESHTESELVPQRIVLPLPDQDRAKIEKSLKLLKLLRFNLLELFSLTTLIGVVMGIACWMPITIFSLLLGLGTLITLASIAGERTSSRTKWVIGLTLVVMYAGSVVIAIVRLNS